MNRRSLIVAAVVVFIAGILAANTLFTGRCG